MGRLINELLEIDLFQATINSLQYIYNIIF